MDQIFGTWYENKYVDAGVKTIVLLVVFALAIWVYNLFGGKPTIALKDYFETLWMPVILVAIVGFGAFYYAASAHRKYRHHLNQRAAHLSQMIKAKQKKKK